MARMLSRVFRLGLLFLTVGLSSAFGQSSDAQSVPQGAKQGPMNRWTNQMVLRENPLNGAADLKTRFGTHKGYDRLVFEMSGDLPNYYVTYEKFPFVIGDSQEIRNIPGKAFIEISFYPVQYSEAVYNTEINDTLKPGERVSLPTLRTVKFLGWWEGEMRYAIGLKGRRPFRVQEFSNPTRLVVDFKR